MNDSTPSWVSTRQNAYRFSEECDHKVQLHAVKDDYDIAVFRLVLDEANPKALPQSLKISNISAAISSSGAGNKAKQLIWAVGYAGDDIVPRKDDFPDYLIDSGLENEDKIELQHDNKIITKFDLMLQVYLRQLKKLDGKAGQELIQLMESRTMASTVYGQQEVDFDTANESR